MIRIVKGAAPAVLLGRGVAEANRHRQDYNNDPAAYDSGKKKLKIKDTIYGHATVRAELARIHHGKCAFCEVLIPKPYADSHVEHWRPKGSVKQMRGGPDLHPGYYWLAYDWDNLLLACQFCNRDNKRTLFPLSNPTRRARNHHGFVTAERPQLLKPDGTTNPARHIKFVDELPRGRTAKGRATIAALGLDSLEHKPREALLFSLRQAHAEVVKYNGDPHPAAQQLVAVNRALYAVAPQPSSQFSAMAAAFIALNPLPPPV